MQDLKQIIIVFLSINYLKSECAFQVKIFTNLEEQSDKIFFKSDFQKVIHNFGHLLQLAFYFVDRGPQITARICVLQQIHNNSYLQATYLDCEADGKSIDACRKFFLIDTNEYDNCTNNIKTILEQADKEYERANVTFQDLPAATFPNLETVKSLTYDKFQKAFCDSYDKNIPASCHELNSGLITDNIKQADKYLKAVSEILKTLDFELNDTTEQGIPESTPTTENNTESNNETISNTTARDDIKDKDGEISNVDVDKDDISLETFDGVLDTVNKSDEDELRKMILYLS